MSEVKAYAAAGRIGRVLAARLLPGQDVVEGIRELIKLNDITSGTITALGSLRSAKVVWAGSMEFGDNPMDVAVFHEMAGPVDGIFCAGRIHSIDPGNCVCLSFRIVS